MAEIVNLNKARKATQRAAKKQQAAENAVKYGLSKVDKTLVKARADKATRAFDGKRRGE